MDTQSPNPSIHEHHASHRILLLCLARNCEATLPSFFAFLGRLRRSGLTCHAIVGENNSTDNTRTLLLAARHHDVEVFDTGLMAHIHARLARMALGRQALLEFAKADSDNYDYVCIADLDDAMISPPSALAVLEASQYLAAHRHLFALGATSFPVYYDLLSLRADGHDYTTLFSDLCAAKTRPLQYFHFHQRYIYNRQRAIVTTRPLQCTSSFNGFCLYRAADYFTGTYRSSDEELICEHVTLNHSIRNATKKTMLITPSLVIQAPPDHTPVGFRRFWANRLATATNGWLKTHPWLEKVIVL